MDKQAFIAAIVAHFEAERHIFLRAAQASYEAATHEENRAENKYDTRGLEASYMAASNTKRAMDIQQTVSIYRTLQWRSFDDTDTIAMSALVTLAHRDGSSLYFIGPRGGGTQLTHEGSAVTIITAASPLGKALMGSEVGDEVTVGAKTYEIIDLA